MVCLGETEAVVTFFPPVDIGIGWATARKLAEFCFRQVSSGVQAANTGDSSSSPAGQSPGKAA